MEPNCLSASMRQHRCAVGGPGCASHKVHQSWQLVGMTHMTQMTHVTQLAGSQTYHAHQQACGSIVALLVALLVLITRCTNLG